MSSDEHFTAMQNLRKAINDPATPADQRDAAQGMYQQHLQSYQHDKMQEDEAARAAKPAPVQKPVTPSGSGFGGAVLDATGLGKLKKF